MAEKGVTPSDPKGQHESPETEVKMECEDVMSGTGSVDMAEERTDSEKATGSKSTEPVSSPATSDTTSGLELGFDTPADTPSGAESFPLVPVPADDPADQASSPPQKPGKISAFGAIRKILSPPKDKVHDEDSTGLKSKYGSGMSFLRTRFRASKSMMSNPERSLDTAIEEEPSELADDDRPTSTTASPQKKPHMGIGSKIRKSLSSMAGFFIGIKGSGTTPIPEAVGLMAEAEASELAAGAAALKVQELAAPAAEDSAEEETTPEFEPYWTDPRTSTSSQPDATQMTDAPSGYSDETLSRASSEKSSEAAVENLDSPSEKEASTNVVGKTAGEAAVAGQEGSAGQEASEITVTVEISVETSIESPTSPPVQEVSEPSKAKTPVKRQAETPAEVLIQEEGATASPWKKPNVPECEQMVLEEDKDVENETTKDS